MPEPDLQVRTVETSRGRVGVRRSGSGPAFVLLHPLALSSACFVDLQRRLAQTFDVVAVDLRGHGVSDWDGKPFEITDLADDVAALLDALDLDEVRIAGLSLGGSVAIALAGRHGDRVAALVAADTTAWYGEDAVAAWTQRAERAEASPRTAQVPFQVDRWFTEPFRRTRPEVVSRTVGIFLATSSSVHAATSAAMGRMDSRELLPRIIAPTLALAGAEDYATPPAMAGATADLAPHGSLLVLPGVRHLSLVERPDLSDVLTAHAEGRALPAVDPAPPCCRVRSDAHPQEVHS
jgi:3-oxoadipate enol-lactonase